MMIVQSAEKLDNWRVAFRPWVLAVILVAMSPALHTVVTWDLDGRLMPQAFAVRHYSYIIVLIEVLIVGLALRHGMSIGAAFLALPKAVSILAGLWLAFAIVGLVWPASDMANATFILVRYAIHGLFLVALVHLLPKSDGFDTRLWLAILSGGAIVYVLLLVIFCLVIPEPENFPWALRLPSATNVRQIGNNVGILAIAPIALLIAKGRPLEWQHVFAFVMVFAFATWTGSRATILGLAVGVGLGLLIARNVSSLRNIIVTASSAIAGIIASLLAPVPDPIFGLFRLFNASSEQVDPSSGRWEFWAHTWQQILQSPWIGHGAGRFTKEMNLVYGTEWNHPHNFILQYIYDWGFLGGSIALVILALLGLKIWRVRAAEPVAHFAAITAFGAICTTALIDGPLYHPLPIVIALALIAPVFAKIDPI